MKVRDTSVALQLAYSDAKLSGMYFAWAKGSLHKARDCRLDKEPRMATTHVTSAREQWHKYLHHRREYCRWLVRGVAQVAA